MKLDYTFGGISPIWYSGNLPFPDMHTERVKVSISGTASGRFPPVFVIGDLLCYWRPSSDESGIVLLLEFHAGNNPSSTVAPALGEWVPVPGAPIIGQIRVALTPEAVKLIQKTSGEGYDYELTLKDVTLIDKTPKQVA